MGDKNRELLKGSRLLIQALEDAIVTLSDSEQRASLRQEIVALQHTLATLRLDDNRDLEQEVRQYINWVLGDSDDPEPDTPGIEQLKGQISETITNILTDADSWSDEEREAFLDSLKESAHEIARSEMGPLAFVVAFTLLSALAIGIRLSVAHIIGGPVSPEEIIPKALSTFTTLTMFTSAGFYAANFNPLTRKAWKQLSDGQLGKPVTDMLYSSVLMLPEAGLFLAAHMSTLRNRLGLDPSALDLLHTVIGRLEDQTAEAQRLDAAETRLGIPDDNADRHIKGTADPDGDHLHL